MTPAPVSPVTLALGGKFPNGSGPPLFTTEGDYTAAAAHNAPFAKPGPYQTPLTPAQKQAFEAWVSRYRVPVTPDYDMPGYFLASGGNPHSSGAHFPDTFKTPLDTSFSDESKYAKPDTPFVWHGDTLVDARTGQKIFGSPLAQAAGRKPTR